MLDIKLEIGRINYQKCVEALLPPLVEHCAAKQNPNALDSYLAGLGDDAVPAACAVLDKMSIDEKDKMVIWLIMSHEERLRSASNRHLEAFFKGPMVRIGRLIALDQTGDGMSLLASEVEVDYEKLLHSPVVTEKIERIGGENSVLKGAAKMMLSMGRLMSPEGLEKQGLSLFNSRRVKEKLMGAVTGGLKQAGLDIEIADMTAQISTGSLPMNAAAQIPAGYEQELMDALSEQVRSMREA